MEHWQQRVAEDGRWTRTLSFGRRTGRGSGRDEDNAAVGRSRQAGRHETTMGSEHVDAGAEGDDTPAAGGGRGCGRRAQRR